MILIAQSFKPTKPGQATKKMDPKLQNHPKSMRIETIKQVCDTRLEKRETLVLQKKQGSLEKKFETSVWSSLHLEISVAAVSSLGLQNQESTSFPHHPHPSFSCFERTINRLFQTPPRLQLEMNPSHPMAIIQPLPAATCYQDTIPSFKAPDAFIHHISQAPR